jgi:predicted regulator of Ras-like GTPase activity (Roadblock/LC7/MglB family)
MMFKEALQTIVEKTDGSLGALIMGSDGLSVERFFTDEGNAANLDVAAAEFTSLVRCDLVRISTWETFTRS